jgi:NADPH:quinone reductase
MQTCNIIIYPQQQESVYALPDSMDFVLASGFTVAYQTSYYALKSRAQLQRGETVLVLGGAGGCGLAAIQVL